MLLKISLFIFLFSLSFAEKHSKLFSSRRSSKFRNEFAKRELEESNLRDEAMLKKINSLIDIHYKSKIDKEIETRPSIREKVREEVEDNKIIKSKHKVQEEVREEDNKIVEPRHRVQEEGREEEDNKIIRPRHKERDEVKKEGEDNKFIEPRHKEREEVREEEEDNKIIQRKVQKEVREEDNKIVEPRHKVQEEVREEEDNKIIRPRHKEREEVRKEGEDNKFIEPRHEEREEVREEEEENKTIQSRHKIREEVREEDDENRIFQLRREEIKEKISDVKFSDKDFDDKEDKGYSPAKKNHKKSNTLGLDEFKKNGYNLIDNLLRSVAHRDDTRMGLDQKSNKKLLEKIDADEMDTRELYQARKKNKKEFETANKVDEKNSDNKVDDDDDDNDDDEDESNDDEPNLVYIGSSSDDDDDDDDDEEEEKFQENDKILKEKMTNKQAVDPCGTSAPLVIQTPGTVKSPGYATNTLPKSAKCSWKIVAPAGRVVKLSITELTMEDSTLCQYDSLLIFDVKAGSGLKMGRYCGRTIPPELLKSTENVMFVYYVSDNVDNAGKFSFSWTFESAQAPAPSTPICGLPKFKPKGTEKIVNGEVATAHSWPWQVSLRLVVAGKQYQICGGTIVSKTIVLTAAHCVFDERHRLRPISDFAIVAGDHDQTTTSDGQNQTPGIKRLVVHEQYNPASASSPYDIAIFEVNGGFTFNDNVIPACLPTETAGNNDICYATGWGDTKGTGKQTLLNQVLLPIVQYSVCSQSDHYGNVIKPSMVCAGYEEGQKDACQGDSGGPLVCQKNNRWYLQGITSFGDGCALPRKPGIYTRVTAYLDWIKDKSGVIP